MSSERVHGERLPEAQPASLANFPEVSYIFRLFREHKEGKLNPPKAVQLSLEGFKELLQQIRKSPLKGYIESTIRYDYDSRSNEFFIRMTTGIHECLLHGMDFCFNTQLLREQKRVGVEEMIDCRRSMRVQLPGHNTRFVSCPDSSYYVEGEIYPRVIIEVSYSQRKSNLGRLADDYIVVSRGHIGLVVGIKLGYNTSKEAMVLMWVPDRGARRSKLIKSEVFRDMNGDPVEGVLEIQPSYFFPEWVLNRAGTESVRPVTISHMELCKYLSKGESAEEGFRMQCAALEGVPGHHGLSPSPEPVLSDEREASFLEADERAEKWMEDEDGSWRGMAENHPTGQVRRSLRLKELREKKIHH